ncbi:hypothetical protein D5F01_LYC25132 [Larimichthys crocea]|uniref:C-type lectin domain-containing protein n=1 Tax=Larimichthys crocea TaxID=215358 RepID=A0A6G0HDI8_LARCR|nr:hypothetical protein D5F01_LYC25132 [Larimichthys crocea]
MDVLLLLIVAASGLCAVSSHAGRQYHFVYELKTWTEARSYCREKYTDLATIDNMEDMNTLNSMVDLSKMAKVGYKHTERLSSQTGMKINQPMQSGEHCTLMDESGRWHDDVCERSYKSVCMYVKGSDVTFVLINKTMTWTEAQNYCRTNYTDLASVRNMTENQKIQDLKASTTKRVIKLRVLKKTSGQDLNDPAVNEQMLEQLRQRLKDHGVNPDDVKLSWRKQADGKVFHKVEKKTRRRQRRLSSNVGFSESIKDIFFVL